MVGRTDSAFILKVHDPTDPCSRNLVFYISAVEDTTPESIARQILATMTTRDHVGPDSLTTYVSPMNRASALPSVISAIRLRYTERAPCPTAFPIARVQEELAVAASSTVARSPDLHHARQIYDNYVGGALRCRAMKGKPGSQHGLEIAVTIPKTNIELAPGTFAVVTGGT